MKITLSYKLKSYKNYNKIKVKMFRCFQVSMGKNPQSNKSLKFKIIKVNKQLRIWKVSYSNIKKNLKNKHKH